MTINAQSAIKYNSAQGYSRATWQRVQMVLGSRPDGIPGEETALDVAAYQAANALTVDGKVGGETLPVFLADKAPFHDIERVSLYWDIPAAWTLRNLGSLLERLTAGGIDAVKVMLTGSTDRTWAPRWTVAQLRAFARALAAIGVELIPVAWALPYRAYLAGFAAGIVELAEAAGAREVELDAEEHLKGTRVKDYPKDRVALMSDLNKVMKIIRDSGRLATVSTYSDLFGKKDRFHAILVASSDGLSLQGYQVEGGDDGRYDLEGPAIKQFDGIKRARERVSPLPRPCTLAVAVALWDQDWSEIKAPESQLLSVEQCVRLGVNRIDAWGALKWLWPHADARQIAYNSEFFPRLKALRSER